MDSFGFIITRHINSVNTNKYWNQSIKLLRTLYPYRKIVVIDDNSDQQFVKADFEYQNVVYIQSSFPKRGELLPYYYFIQNNFFDNAVIIHDSIFFHKRLNFETLIKKGIQVMPLWHFTQDDENISNTLRITRHLKNTHYLQKQLLIHKEVIGLPQKKWFGCFGVQSFINRNFLLHIETKYTISNMIY